MASRPKKLTNMIWRKMGEGAGFSLALLFFILYFLHTYGYLTIEASWFQLAVHGLTVVVLGIGAGVIFGFLQSLRTKRRIDQLQHAMLYLEKGNLIHDIPEMGEDEFGRLRDQFVRIGKKWEDQVSSLQRLSTNNAKLAEQARFSAVMEERQRLARDLHDAVSQQLFAISMTATAAGRTLEQDIDKAKRQIALIEEMSSVAQSEMRALLLHLRPVHLKGKSLAQGLGELVQELQAKIPMNIRFDMDELMQLNKGVEDQLFRIVQEALSNILRHSRASRTDIRLYLDNDVVKLLIRDNGVGFDLNEKKHASYGIESMRERVNEIGGSMQIITAPGKGTRLDIRVPLVNDEEEEH